MNNLSKKIVKVYQKRSSNREIYEQERFYLIKVEDRTGIIDEKGGDEFVEKMYERMQCGKLNSFIEESIDVKRYDIFVNILDRGGDIVAKVIISKRRISEELKELANMLFDKIFVA